MTAFRGCLLIIGLLCPLLADAEIALETESLHLRFSDRGDLVRAEACFPACGDARAKRLELSGRGGMLVLEQPTGQRLAAERGALGDATVLTFSGPDGAVAHRWRIPQRGWMLALESTAAKAASLTSGEEFRPAPSSGFGDWLEQTRYLVFDGNDVSVIGLDEGEPYGSVSKGWFGFRNRFWTAMVLSESPLSITAVTGGGARDAAIRFEQGEGSSGLNVSLYLGPVEPGALAGAGLEDMMYSGLWFWLRWICQGMYWLLNAIALAVPHWGLAVMLLSLTVGILMRPLSRIADRLQGQVHEIDARLSPLLSEIKKNYKGAEQSEKIIEMYKAEGVHPLYSLKSLAGVAVVIPVFIGAFDMLAENIHLSGESFLWIADLSHPDRFWPLPFELPFFGAWLNLLPFIMTGFSFIASKLHAHPAMDELQRRKQARNLIVMSLGFLVLFYTFPAGMVLYWTTNNLISVVKTLWKRRGQSKMPE